MLTTFCMGMAIKQTQVMRLTELCIVAIIQSIYAFGTCFWAMMRETKEGEAFLRDGPLYIL